VGKVLVDIVNDVANVDVAACRKVAVDDEILAEGRGYFQSATFSED
jgi:hypothetical protein